jgi:molybdopterin molybdotransferase
MAGDHTRKRSERMLFFPVRINKNMEVETIEYHGSAHLNAYRQAEGMAAFPIGINILKKGTIVDVRPL